MILSIRTRIVKSTKYRRRDEIRIVTTHLTKICIPGIPASHQHLLLGQTELLDDVCLMEQGVVDGSTLRLVLAMRGGPINARRLPTTQDDMFWREVTGFVDENKSVSGGRARALTWIDRCR